MTATPTGKWTWSHRIRVKIRQCQALLIVLLLGVSPVSSVSAEPLRIAVASNFAAALESLQENFTAESGHHLTLVSGSTGKHYAQILQGAPFDVFLAADEARPGLLESQGYAVEGSRFTYALGRLALWTPEIANPYTSTPDSAARRLDLMLQATPDMRLSLANPRLAPYGMAAQEWLLANALWDRVTARAVQGENIGQAFHFVATGSVPAGLIAGSQLSSPLVSEGDYLLIDTQDHPPIRQQAVVLKDSPAAQQFVTWLQSDPVRAQIESIGYDLPHAEP